MQQLQENALKFYMDMPIETQIEIPQAAFEFRHNHSLKHQETRTEYLLMKKQEQLLEFQRNL
jgi:hypothetical protein